MWGSQHAHCNSVPSGESIHSLALTSHTDASSPHPPPPLVPLNMCHSTWRGSKDRTGTRLLYMNNQNVMDSRRVNLVHNELTLISQKVRNRWRHLSCLQSIHNMLGAKSDMRRRQSAAAHTLSTTCRIPINVYYGVHGAHMYVPPFHPRPVFVNLWCT